MKYVSKIFNIIDHVLISDFEVENTKIFMHTGYGSLDIYIEFREYVPNNPVS